MRTPLPYRLASCLLAWFLGPSLSAADAPAPLPSTVFAWGELEVQATPVGERRDVCDQPTATLERLECHISTLRPGLASHPPHTHTQEELIILTKGSLDVFINGHVTRVGPGSVFWFAANDPHAVNNRGTEPATYFVFNFATAATRDVPPVGTPRPAASGALPSRIWQGEALAGARAANEEPEVTFVNQATVTLERLTGRLSTLAPGATLHTDARHAEEEIVFVADGTMEATFNGRTQRAEAGSILYLAPQDTHALRNIGDSPATCYVLRIRTDQTQGVPDRLPAG